MERAERRSVAAGVGQHPLGELYVETGNMEKAKEQLAVLAKLCPGGCEEREDLQKAISAKSASN